MSNVMQDEAPQPNQAIIVGGAALLALALGAIAGPAFLGSRPGPMAAPTARVERAEHSAPAIAPVIEATAPPAEPTPAPQPTGFIEPVEQAPAQAAPAAPQPAVYVAPAPVVVTDLQPLPTEVPIDCASRGIGPCRGARP
jgi:hypothetical protein